jgi:hypothetical protein
MRRATASKAVLCAIVLTAAGLAHAAQAERRGASTGDELARSRAMTAEPAISFADPGRTYENGASARRASASVAEDIPLPDGGNFNGIRWTAVEGSLFAADIHFVLEFNAACQWLRAFHDGREKAAAREILAAVPAWPTFRANERGELAREAFDELSKGASGGVVAAFLADCDATHQREVQWAAQQGLEPSS